MIHIINSKCELLAGRCTLARHVRAEENACVLPGYMWGDLRVERLGQGSGFRV